MSAKMVAVPSAYGRWNVYVIRGRESVFLFEAESLDAAIQRANFENGAFEFGVVIGEERL